MNLFENFERAVRDAIAGEIRRGRLGQLTAQMQSRTRYSRGAIRRLAGAAQSRIDRFTSQTFREARQSVWRALRSALDPLANLLRGLSGSWNRGGGGAGQPPAPPGAFPAGDAPDPIRSNLDAAIRDAIGLLESQGYTVNAPGTQPESFGFRPADESASSVRFEPKVEMPGGGDVVVGGRRRAANPNDPVFTGEMIPVESSNVHSIGFIWNTDDPMKGTLKVRFLHSAKGGNKKGPGPLYHYDGVHPDVFDAFIRANSKGGFVWDRLRIRGTVTGHRFHYELKGITNGYVPRKATRIGKNEYFVGRSAKFRNKNGEVREFSSSLPDQFVQNLGGGPGNRRRGPGGFVPAEPNRGRPNRGRP